MDIFAISNQKGGVGKTTTAVALGGLFAQAGKRVLLVDMDPQGSLTTYFHFEQDDLKGSVYRCFLERDDLFSNRLSRESIQSWILPTLFSGLSLLPSSCLLSLVEREQGKDHQTKQGIGLVLSATLKKLSGLYDVILIDSPPQLGVLMINTLAACDRLIIPVQTEFLALKGLEKMLRTVQMVMTSLHREASSIDDILIMPTLFDRRTQSSLGSLKHLRSHYADFMWDAMIPVDTQLRNASKAGVPPSLYSPQSHGVIAYKLLLNFLTVSKEMTCAG